jgi:signal transduction histidine kinase
LEQAKPARVVLQGRVAGLSFASSWLTLMTKENQIRRAWEGFIENGAVSIGLRGVIAESWQRSQNHGIPVERKGAPLALEPELLQRYSAYSTLVEAARPALGQARLFLAEANSMIILTDPSGLILETAGDPRTIDFGHLLHLEQGGRWKEADMGTNAIGTAIAVSEPVQIHGVEHFCSEVGVWTCAATPIWHPNDGELLGVVDISGPVQTFNPQSLAFACAVGRQIEGVLAQSIKDDHERLLRYFITKRSRWLNEDIVAIDCRGMIVYATNAVLQMVNRRHQGLIRDGHVSSLKTVPFAAWPTRLSQLLPNASTELIVDQNREIGAILVLHRPLRTSVPTVIPEEMPSPLQTEREIFARQRTVELAKANEALRGSLDALAAVPDLDEFLGQVMAAITRQLGAASSVLQLRNFETNCLTVDLVFQDGRVMTPSEAKYPEQLRSIRLDERKLGLLNQPAAVLHLLDDLTPIPDALRSCLLELSVKTLLVIPLNLATQLIGSLTFRFTEDREFRPEEIEVARALESQAALAIQVTRLVKAARQSAVLEERNRLAGEIHDGLAQSFTAICMQLGVAKEELSAKEGDPFGRIQRAVELANLGLAEARRCAHDLRLSLVDESGLAVALQGLVDRTSLPGRLRCDFRSDNIPEKNLPPGVQHELLRIAQEAIHNAARHGNPTLVSVSLLWDAPNLVLQVKDNGSGIPKVPLDTNEGFGLKNMRARASQIGGKMEIQTAAGHGTSVTVTVPIISSADSQMEMDSRRR